MGSLTGNWVYDVERDVFVWETRRGALLRAKLAPVGAVLKRAGGVLLRGFALAALLAAYAVVLFGRICAVVDRQALNRWIRREARAAARHCGALARTREWYFVPFLVVAAGALFAATMAVIVLLWAVMAGAPAVGRFAEQRVIPALRRYI